MATLSLQIPQPSVVHGKAFAGTVTIAGARPSAAVSVSVRQVQGTGSWAGGAKVNVDAQGAGVAPIAGIVLAGDPTGSPEVATLLADASDDAGDYFWSDAQSVQVI